MTRNYGFILPTIKQEDFVFGDAQINAPVLQEDGQWDAHLPTDEFQNLQGFEPYACASFGTLNCIETLLKRKFGFNDNYSDRYLAKMTGTDKLHGNDPHAVAEFLRKSGDVEEYEWPILNTTTFDEYYRTPPAPLSVSALTFTKHYEFFHDYVPNDPKSMMNALKYSPLGISVFAWEDRGDGIMKAGDTLSQNHWVMLWGYKENEYWLVFDSYDNSHKKLEWSHRPAVAKRYHIDLAPQAATLLETLKKSLQSLHALLQSLIAKQGAEAKDPPAPVTNPPATVPQTARLIDFCKALRTHEGWYEGSRSFRNNNPGNCKYSSQGYASVYGNVGRDADGFAVFPTYAQGWLYLQNLVKGKIKAHPEWSLHDFFTVYAPAFENDVLAYVTFVADYLKVDSRTFRIKNLTY